MEVSETIREARKRYGWRGVPYVLISRFDARPRRVPVRAPGIRHPLTLRTHTTDRFAFAEIFLQRAYQVELRRKPRTIVDCGANIGFASVYYANRYPRSRIIAIEPDPGNFRICERNVRRYRRITPVHAAVWSANQKLSVYDPGDEHGEWGVRVVDAEPPGGRRIRSEVPGFTLDRIMEELGIEHIDLLKVDIEGAEREVFRDASRWIDRVGVIVIELHDRFEPGCESAVRSALEGFKVQFLRAPNLHVFGRHGRIRWRENRHLMMPDDPSIGV